MFACEWNTQEMDSIPALTATLYTCMTTIDWNLRKLKTLVDDGGLAGNPFGDNGPRPTWDMTRV
jgi:hypothetical protein